MSALVTAANRVVKELLADREILNQARSAAQSGDEKKAIEILLNNNQMVNFNGN